MALFLSEQALNGILNDLRVRAEFPQLSSLWRETRNKKPCKCNRSKARTKILQRAKRAITSLPPAKLGRLKEILGIKNIEVCTLEGGVVKQVTL